MKPATLQRLDPVASDPLGFESLRAAGIQALQELAGARWTDHNLHDPGITLLEAWCYALTELVYRGEAPLPELLAGVPAQALAQHPAGAVLPCRAATADDLRRWLLDQVDGLHDARLQAGPDGLWHLTLQPEADLAALAALEHAARRAYARQRQLGEDLHAQPTLCAVQDCRLRATVDIAGARDPAELLAELQHVAAQWLAGWPGEPGDPDAGPALQHPQRALPRAPTDDLEDALLARLRAVEGVRDIPSLHLDPPLRLDAAQRAGAPLALRLQLPADLQLQRRGSPVAVDRERAGVRLADLQRAALAPRRGAPAEPPPELTSEPTSEPAPLMQASSAEPWPYASLQGLLPAVYGLQRNADAPETRALRGYLALFDQGLLDAQTQLQALPRLFAAEPGPRSLWQRPLTEREAPGVAALTRERTPEEQASDPLWTLDPALERQHRALDAQLALHGQVFSQNTLRQFLPVGSDVDAALLAAKRAFVRALPALNRDRGAGLDPFEPEAPPCGLLQRLPLLLGLPPQPPRLRDALQASGVQALREDALDAPLPPRAQALPFDADAGDPIPVSLPEQLPLALLRCAAQPLHWRWAEGALWLAGEASDRGWRLADAPDRAQARRAAVAWRAALQPLLDASEGLQLVDHILLRPRADPQVPPAPWQRLRASLLLPNWSARTAQDGFFTFVQETVQHNAPAHVRVRCERLPLAAWLRLEDALQPWQQALRRWSEAPHEPARAQALDAASARLAEALPPGLRA